MRRVLIPYCCILLVSGIAAPALTQSPDPTPDPRKCRLSRAADEAIESVAKRCAEDFVRRNGYTDAAADVDSIVRESFESWSSVADVLRRRHKSLNADAYSTGCSDDGCGVTFGHGGPRTPCAFRIVTMTREFTLMRMEHQLVMPAPDTPDGQRCRRLSPDLYGATEGGAEQNVSPDAPMRRAGER